MVYATKLAADFVGMTTKELAAALRSEATCPLCIETGGPHSNKLCAGVLDVMADRNADAINSQF